MKKVLLPTDFSDNSWSSLVYALNLFKDQACKFYLLNTINLDPTSITNFSSNKLNIAKEKAMAKLEALKIEAEKINLNTNHTFETVLSFYYLDQALDYTYKKHGIDIAIMGTKGANNIKDKFLGSNTTRVIKNLKSCPVLAVPDEFYFEDVKKIALLTDLIHPMGSDLLKPVADLAKENQSEIKVLHISKDNEISNAQEQELITIKESLKEIPNSFHIIESYNSKEKITNEFVSDLGINLLVLLYYKNDFFQQLIKKSLATSISQHLKIPMLILPKKE